MAGLRDLVVFLSAGLVALGCHSRALDDNGTSLGGVPHRDGGAFAEGGASADGAHPPWDAILLEAGPPSTCGDGVVQSSEQCDDGNKLAGDGCSPICQIECGALCGGCGRNTCITSDVCGDGVLGASEACDDGNLQGGDGCAPDCDSVEPGWRCPFPGGRCVPICGDGAVVGLETCDDGNTTAGDGCSDLCLVEPSTARCDDGVIEGAEACDDGAANSDATYGSGCTTLCQPPALCGDGVLNGPEECDLGSTRNIMFYGDPAGCTPTCRRAHYCGDANVDSNYREECDQGPANGSPGSACTATCKLIII
jgi:cysteine-rich repeat protein